ncbi:MAG: hypothetical protein EXS59_02110 [Candidatus Taylorbacteria bacterium]|nr:hypothetical protein [Candidatus Taylorbacteria bacterium]
MRYTFEQWDITLAVIARRTSLHEFSAHSNEDRSKIIWEPTQIFLEGMAKDRPKQILCFFGSKFQFPDFPDCVCQNLYIVNCNKQVAYIGTVFNPLALKMYKTRLLESDAKFLSRTKISRGRLLYCVIPTPKNQIDDLVVFESIRKYFGTYPAKTMIPYLSNTLICLLSQKAGEKIDDEIMKLAKQTAKTVSEKVEIQKYNEDKLW